MQMYTRDGQLRLFKTAPHNGTSSSRDDMAAVIALDPTRSSIPSSSVFGPETFRQVGATYAMFYSVANFLDELRAIIGQAHSA